MKQLIVLFGLLALGLVSCRKSNDYPVINNGAEGILPNGIKYYVLKTPWVKGKASLGMVVNTGSLYETQDEIGCAHFLEHMCFKSVPGYNGKDKTLDFVNRGGLNIYNDWQAFTSEYTTVYKFIYPIGDDETQGEMINFINGVISGMVFNEEAIEIERQVILKETETSYANSPNKNYSGGYFEHHRTLGDSAQIAAITGEKLNQFYRKWYRPENIALVMAGNEPLDQMEQQLIKAFSHTRCVVDSALPKAFLPINESNIDLYASRHNTNKINATVNYRYQRSGVRNKEDLHKSLAHEMTGNLLKGALEQKRDFKVNIGHGINPGIVVSFTCKDSADFRTKLETIGNTISHLKYKGADQRLIDQVWKEYPSVYTNAMKIDTVPVLNTVLSNVFRFFTHDRPFTQPKYFKKLVNNEGTSLNPADIKEAAITIFNQTLGMVAEFPDYGKAWESKMLKVLDSSSNKPEANVELGVPQKIRFKRPEPKNRKMLPVKASKEYTSYVLNEKILENGVYTYTLSNGMKLVWLRNSREKSLLISIDNGIQHVPAQYREFMRLFSTVNIDSVSGVDKEFLDKQLFDWGLHSGIHPRLGERTITCKINWSLDNTSFLWPYLNLYYKGIGISDFEYQKNLDRFNDKADIKPNKNTYYFFMTGSEVLPTPAPGDRKILSKKELEDYFNRLNNPANTTICIQGETDIEKMISWMGSIPVKGTLSAGQGQSWLPESNMIIKSEKARAKTLNVNRLYKMHQAEWSLKNYLLNGMFEEYMNRQCLRILRNEEGLVYAWGSSSYSGKEPHAFTTTSIRYKIVPELRDQSLQVLNRICDDVKENGIHEEELRGLKNREWNRYLDSWNAEKERLDFFNYQLKTKGRLWADKEVKSTIESISSRELNDFVQNMLAQPSVTLIN
ncbi:insulinase family protein [Carboxylicivirga sp. RSCT41]|uniref:insulinase family protein n=1 Tax=Carboxylicivirga agarovorans TaxID=3417570 RepID=UPI003D33D72C